MKEWRKRLQGLGKVLLRLSPDLMAIAGAVCVAYGISMIYGPAGWISSGIICIAAAVIVSKGGGGG